MHRLLSWICLLALPLAAGAAPVGYWVNLQQGWELELRDDGTFRLVTPGETVGGRYTTSKDTLRLTSEAGTSREYTFGRPEFARLTLTPEDGSAIDLRLLNAPEPLEDEEVLPLVAILPRLLGEEPSPAGWSRLRDSVQRSFQANPEALRGMLKASAAALEVWEVAPGPFERAALRQGLIRSLLTVDGTDPTEGEMAVRRFFQESTPVVLIDDEFGLAVTRMDIESLYRFLARVFVFLDLGVQPLPRDEFEAAVLASYAEMPEPVRFVVASGSVLVPPAVGNLASETSATAALGEFWQGDREGLLVLAGDGEETRAIPIETFSRLASMITEAIRGLAGEE